MKAPHEETMPRHRIDALTWDNESEARRRLLDSAFCDRCRRLALRTETDARSYIGLLLSNPKRHARTNEFALVPFPCPFVKGTWHVGRNHKTAELIRGNIQ